VNRGIVVGGIAAIMLAGAANVDAAPIFAIPDVLLCVSASATSDGATSSEAFCPGDSVNVVNGLAQAVALVHVESRETPSSFSGAASSFAGTAVGLADESASARGFTIYTLGFRLTTPHTYELSGVLNASGDFGSSLMAEVLLFGVFSASSFSGRVPFLDRAASIQATIAR
jgi:hypothetical protein